MVHNTDNIIFKGKLLRKLLQVCAVSDLASSGYNTGQMGHEEIEEFERPFNEGGLLVGKICQKAIQKL